MVTQQLFCIRKECTTLGRDHSIPLAHNPKYVRSVRRSSGAPLRIALDNTDVVLRKPEKTRFFVKNRLFWIKHLNYVTKPTVMPMKSLYIMRERLERPQKVKNTQQCDVTLRPVFRGDVRRAVTSANLYSNIVCCLQDWL